MIWRSNFMMHNSKLKNWFFRSLHQHFLHLFLFLPFSSFLFLFLQFVFLASTAVLWVSESSFIIIIIIGIQPLGRSGQRPEFSQVTGIALVRCILGKFLGVACHCFPPLFRCSHFSPTGASTSATTWEIPGRKWELWARMLSEFCRNDDFHAI